MYIQFNSIHLFSIIKKQQNTLKVRTCTQQDGGGTTKSKSLKMLYPLYKQIVQYKHERKKHKQHKQIQASKNIIPLKYDKKEFSKQ